MSRSRAWGCAPGLSRRASGNRHRFRKHIERSRLHLLILNLHQQPLPLLDTEAVLLIDNHEAQAVKFYSILDERMRTDDHINRAACNLLVERLAGFTLDAANQQTNRYAERLEQFSQRLGKISVGAMNAV